MANNNSNRFTKCIEILLTGKIVCHSLFPELYSFLTETDENGELINEFKIDTFLRQINRKLVKTSDEMGYYCVFNDYESSLAKDSGKNSIKEVVCEFEPLIKWLRLIRSCSQDSRPVCAGDIIKPSEIIHSLEESDIHCKQLKDIATVFKVSSSSADVNKMFIAVLKYLVKKEYLVDVNQDGLIYRATARWSYFYDLLEFVKENEGLGKDDLSAEGHQTDMMANVIEDPFDDASEDSLTDKGLL